MEYFTLLHTGLVALPNEKKSFRSWDRCFQNCQTSVVREWGGKTKKNWGQNYFLTIVSSKVNIFLTGAAVFAFICVSGKTLTYLDP